MRTLHYIASFFPYDRGATHSAIRLARGLRERGVDVEFIVEDLGPEWRDGGTYDGFPVRSFPVTNPGKKRKLNGFLSLRRYLRERRGQYDLFHVHGGPYMNLLLAWQAGKWLRCPTMMKMTLDGWDTPDGVAKARHGWWALPLFNRLDGVVAMTSGQAEKCRAWNIKGRVEVIPNGVDTDHFIPLPASEKAALRQSMHLPVDRPIMAYAGYLGDVKGTDILFKTWDRLRQTIPDLQLLLIGNYMGDTNMSASLDAFLERHGIDPALARHPSVHQTGKLDSVVRGLQYADVFVFASRQEGFGTVQIEAMACGLPCVVNDLPGVSCDIYPTEEVGYRIADNRVEGFVAVLENLFASPDTARRVGQAARERAVHHFSVASVAARYLDFYNQLTGHST